MAAAMVAAMAAAMAAGTAAGTTPGTAAGTTPGTAAGTTSGTAAAFLSYYRAARDCRGRERSSRGILEPRHMDRLSAGYR
jgi:hypothetical protein